MALKLASRFAARSLALGARAESPQTGIQCVRPTLFQRERPSERPHSKHARPVREVSGIDTICHGTRQPTASPLERKPDVGARVRHSA